MEDDPNADFIWVAAHGTVLIGLMYAGWIPKPVVFEAFYPLTIVSSFIPETHGTVYALSQGLNFLYTTAAT